MKTIRISILALFLVVVLVGCSASKSPVSDVKDTANSEAEVTVVSEAEDTVAATDSAVTGAIVYNLKINPEFEIQADHNLIVTNIIAKNDDAESVLASVNAIGLNVTEAFDLLTDEARNQGYLTEEKGNTVNITILEKDDEEFPTCSVCGGCGTVVCKDCHGTGIACLCDRCKGTGNDNEPSSDC